MMNTFQKFVYLSFTIALVVYEVILEQANVDILTSRLGNITSPGYPGNFTSNNSKTWILPHPIYSHNSSLVLRFLEMDMIFIFFRRKFVLGDLTIQGQNLALMESGSCVILEKEHCRIQTSQIYENCIVLGNLNRYANLKENLTMNFVANGFNKYLKDKRFKMGYEYVECPEIETTTEANDTPTEKSILLSLTIIFGVVAATAIICLIRSKVKNNLHQDGQNCQTEEMNPELRPEVYAYENIETTRQYEVVGPKQDELGSNLAANAAGYTKMNQDLSKLENIDHLKKDKKILPVKELDATDIVKNKAVSSVTNPELNPEIFSQCMNVNEEKKMQDSSIRTQTQMQAETQTRQCTVLLIKSLIRESQALWDSPQGYTVWLKNSTMMT
uniref:uncharacterized protein LOC120329645 isoform X1 n=1 Tax=Styela clava TaxID=7725 RepID=UPI001939AA6C|nr:uncharacterized protein LOC120329645 isoform X1 [Styela clava]